MSYCRWSCPGSDVYCYEGEDGWVTHVADRRRKIECPVSVVDVLQSCIDGNNEKFLELNGQRHEWLDLHSGDEHWLPVPEPYKGKTYVDTSPGECADRLEKMRAFGVGVPQHAIDALRDE